MNSIPACTTWQTARLRRAAGVLLCLLVFSLQQFVAQTHIHPLQIATTAHHVAQGSGTAIRATPQNHKDEDDEATCGACQLAVAIGSALESVPLALVVLADSAGYAAAWPDEGPSAARLDHIRQSRAPPTAG